MIDLPFSDFAADRRVRALAKIRFVTLDAKSGKPVTEASKDRFAFSVRNKGTMKGFAWVWLEREAPKKPRVPNPAVLAVRVANLAEKDAILASSAKKFFTEPHYNGFPAVLVRLKAVKVTELKLLIRDAWRCQAPKDLVKSFED